MLDEFSGIFLLFSRKSCFIIHYRMIHKNMHFVLCSWFQCLLLLDFQIIHTEVLELKYLILFHNDLFS